MLVICEEKVHSDCSMLCSSPMSAIHPAKDAQFRAQLGRHVQAALRHEGEQAHRLEA